MRNSYGPYGDCFDHLANAGTSGLATNMSVPTTSYQACNGQGVLVVGRIEVTDFTSYQGLGGNPLSGRTVWFDRGTTVAFTSTTATNASGNNWAKSFSGTNVSYVYRAHFDDASGDGLADSDQPTFSITWGSAC